jgi:hypothetical protein
MQSASVVEAAVVHRHKQVVVVVQEHFLLVGLMRQTLAQ